MHINVLESMAVLFALKCFFRDTFNKSILVRSDNSTTVSYVNHLGGVRSREVSDLTIEIYNFCIARNLAIRASFLRGRSNTRADALSRLPRSHCYSLPPHLFDLICSHFDLHPEIDLFASRQNYKLPRYFSLGPDPLAEGFDAFTMPWQGQVYTFPPVMLVGKFLSYFEHFNIEIGLLIAPYWPAQAFFPKVLSLLIDDPLLIPVSLIEGSAQMPRHLLYLMACPISSLPERTKAYQRNLSTASYTASTRRPLLHTYVHGNVFQIGVLKGKLIFARRL